MNRPIVTEPQSVSDALQNGFESATPASRLWNFTIPAMKFAGPNDPKKVTLRELSPADMVTARKLAKDDTGRIGLESIKMSIHMVDGQIVDHGAAQADELWAAWSPKVRMLVTNGWRAIHATSEEEDDAFLASMAPG